MSLLDVQALAVQAGPRCLLRELSFSLPAGGSLALVGESGSGKTQSILAMLGLLAPGLRAQGQAYFDGQPLLGADPETLRALRGRHIGLAWQDALASLNPYLSIGAQLRELLQLHRGLDRAAAQAEALRLLEAVKLSQGTLRLRQYPHELSGGMRQRVMLALALAGRPRLLIADEPTSALDPTVQRQIVELLAELRREQQLALLLITHDLQVVSELCERTLVLYAGEMMEQGETAQLLSRPRHPYTQALLQAQLRVSAALLPTLPSIPGSLPVPGPAQACCVFAPRCTQAVPSCGEQRPRWRTQAASGWRCDLLADSA